MSLYTEACKVIPGGVNSPVRAFRGVGGEPIFFARASGPHVWAVPFGDDVAVDLVRQRAPRELRAQAPRDQRRQVEPQATAERAAQHGVQVGVRCRTQCALR